MLPLLWRGVLQSRGSPGQTHQVSCAVADILGRGYHVDLLVQEIARFFLEELILAHGHQELESYGALLNNC